MRIKKLLYLSLIFLAGCAAYKELQPVPDISYLENGYIELKDSDENFELSEGKKYFIKFPQPAKENILLVLSLNEKPAITSYLTRVFDDGEGQIIKIPDESVEPELTSVYPLDRTVPSFYWVIENVSKDVVLTMQYRYVAAWRYRFEARHAEFDNILKNNTVSRTVLDAIGVSINGNEVDYAGETKSATQKRSELVKLQGQLAEIEKIFPQDILNSQDKSYQDYLTLKKNLAAEKTFQDDYLYMLGLMGAVTPSSIKMAEFTAKAEEYSAFLKNSDKYPENVRNEAKKMIAVQLDDVVPHFERELRKKTGSEAVPYNMAAISALYAASGKTLPKEFTALEDFVGDFNKRSSSLQRINEEIDQVKQILNKPESWPANMFFTDQRARLSKLNYQMPVSETESFGKYKSYACASLLAKQIKSTQSELDGLIGQLQRTEAIVPQINTYREQGNFSSILKLLKENSDISFLLNKYSGIDQSSIDQQKNSIKNAMLAQDWAGAERHLQYLHQDVNFLNPKTILPQKAKIVTAYEDSLYNRILLVSENNAKRFIETNKSAYEEVDTLYNSRDLGPVYLPVFSSRGSSVVKERSDQINKRMETYKNNKFPETAIETLYREMTGALHDNGVEKARAIVTHSRYYKGTDKKIKNLIAECDPTASKWLTTATQYRKIYALPTTTKIGGTNQYMMKINIQIPSDAKFPVFDVNVKLPMEIARNAGKGQWYKSITFNKKVLKNEGRFSITSPSAETNYEMQITPLQVNKTGDNVLEILFDAEAFKVFEVSVMAQRPIMKKD